MYLSKGESRVALVVPSLGIVIKAPIVNVIECVHSLKLFHSGKTIRERFARLRKVLMWSVDHQLSPRRYLFKGIRDNWREWRFWQETRDPLLAPTVFWLPFANVQLYAHPLPLQDGAELKRRFMSLVGDAISRDPHHFYSAKNFGLRNDEFVVVDYASPKVQQILLEHGEKFRWSLNPYP